jgi:nucleotide-binding universal stress UspA family protein
MIVLTVIEDQAQMSWAQGILESACRLLEGIPRVETKIRIGHAALEVIQEAHESHCDLVIVGERQNPNLLARFLSGSTTIRIVEHAPCPVMVAKGKVGPICRILLCDSGAEGPLGDLVRRGGATPSAPAAAPLLARFTAQLADFLQGEEEITVLHIMSQISAAPGVKGTQLRAAAEDLIQERTPEGELLQRDVQLLSRPGVRVRPKVRHGLVLDEILKEAQEGDYDLVVIGAHRGAGWQRVLLDDLAHKILVQLDRPVLVIR